MAAWSDCNAASMPESYAGTTYETHWGETWSRSQVERIADRHGYDIADLPVRSSYDSAEVLDHFGF